MRLNQDNIHKTPKLFPLPTRCAITLRAPPTRAGCEPGRQASKSQLLWFHVLQWTQNLIHLVSDDARGNLLCWVLLMRTRANATSIGLKFIFVLQGGLLILNSFTHTIAEMGLTYWREKTVLKPMAYCIACDLLIVHNLYFYLQTHHYLVAVGI